MFIERQINFRDVDPNWNFSQRRERSRLYPEIDKVCQEAFTQFNNLWNQYSPSVQVHIDDDRLHIENGRSDLSIYERRKELKDPTVGDVNIPDVLAPFVQRYASRTGKGLQSSLPVFRYTATGRIALFGPGSMDESLAVLGGEDIEELYWKWHSDVMADWHKQESPLIGWGVNVTEDRLRYEFSFSKEGSLVGFATTRNHPVIEPLDEMTKGFDNYRKLSTRASFRSGRLVSLYHEVPNGTLFPDPKGEMEEIWPKWVKKGMDEIGTWSAECYGNDDRPATEEDWEWYLDRIRNKKIVFSPVSGNYVRQTENQARRNLAKSKVFIYYANPQAFHFYSKSDDPGFYSEIGYSLWSKSGRGGKYIPKKPKDPRAHIEPTQEQTIELLLGITSQL